MFSWLPSLLSCLHPGVYIAIKGVQRSCMLSGGSGWWESKHMHWRHTLLWKWQRALMAGPNFLQLPDQECSHCSLCFRLVLSSVWCSHVSSILRQKDIARDNWRALSYITQAICWRVMIKIYSEGLEAKPVQCGLHSFYVRATETWWLCLVFLSVLMVTKLQFDVAYNLFSNERFPVPC